MKIAFIGSGNVARALGALLREGGHDVRFGAREGAAAGVEGAVSLEEAAAHGEVVIVAVPFVAAREVLPGLAPALAGKLVIDATNPVGADWSPLVLGAEDSAGETLARLLPGSRVAKAFNTIFADAMRPDRMVRDGQRITCFIATDHADAAATAAELARSAGFSPLPVGPLRAARYLEAMAHLNIQLAVAQGGGTNAAFLYHRASA